MEAVLEETLTSEGKVHATIVEGYKKEDTRNVENTQKIQPSSSQKFDNKRGKFLCTQIATGYKLIQVVR